MDIVRIRRINQIFNNLGWMTFVGAESEQNTAFEKCLELSVMLTDQQFDCFVSLLSKFEKRNMGEVIKGAERTLIQLVRGFEDDLRYAVVPLTLAEDIAKGKAKSAGSLIYPLKNAVQKSLKSHQSGKLDFYQSPDSLAGTAFNSEEMGLIIVDDFVGTGHSVETFVDENKDYLPENRENIIVVSAFSMDSGQQKIAEIGLKSSFGKMHDRGIADNPLITDKATAYDLVDEIEGMIKISDRYRRGYCQSEALMSLGNTPNNTFPIFWASKNNDGRDWPAMFPRV